MLTQLGIRNIVLIEALDLEPGPGLSVLTGETGAGKSILLDSLDLVLGGRGNAGLVRVGAAQAQVSARFESLPPAHPAWAILEEAGLQADAGEDLLLRRVLTADGRSRAYVNDQGCGVQLLRQIGQSLVEIHGQMQAGLLTEAATQRALLDGFGGLGPQAAAVRTAWSAWTAAREALAAADAQAASLAGRLATLLEAESALEALQPQPAELAGLEERRALLAHSGAISQAVATALAALEGEGSAGARRALGQAARALDRVADRAPAALRAVAGALDRAEAELDEAVRGLNAMAESLEHDPTEVERLAERVFALKDLARRFGVDPDNLTRYWARIRAERLALAAPDQLLAELTQKEAAAEAAWTTAAAALSAGRAEAATRLSRAVEAELGPLKMERARFQVALLPRKPGPEGAEEVSFLVATNPGQAPGPIGRIASGGELSRFMLALKVVLADLGGVQTLVFDEVDAGIGGAVAAAVGQRLARLGENLQVLVVTHAPQVAARGSRHWRVEKRLDPAGLTRTEVTALDAEGRAEEIARMLAGAEITAAARAAARQLLRG